MSYQVPAQRFENEYVIKKSRFIARVVPVKSRDEAMAAVADARADYPDARHHCWAYLLGKPADASSAGMNDDGEPAGTAGKPIFNVLQYGHLGDIMVIVIRYFGGIKLGAGGLVRAYSTATVRALELAPAQIHQDYVLLTASGDFSAEQLLRQWLGDGRGRVDAVLYCCFSPNLKLSHDN
ncbi:MAG: YigZ family protein [Halioglobus sp.]